MRTDISDPIPLGGIPLNLIPLDSKKSALLWIDLHKNTRFFSVGTIIPVPEMHLIISRVVKLHGGIQPATHTGTNEN